MSSTEAPPTSAVSARSELRLIPLSQITARDGFNPRGDVLEDERLQALAQTMRDRGCIQPIRVRSDGDGRFVLIAGERRYRAAALAGLSELPATVRAEDEGEDQVEILAEAMVENELREQLDPLQRARGYRAMLDAGLTVRGVAERLGGRRRSREQRIKAHLQILSLPEDLRERVADSSIPLLAVPALVELSEIHEQLARAAVRAVEPCNDYEEPYTWAEVAASPLAVALNVCETAPAGVFSTREEHAVAAFNLGEQASAELMELRDLTGRELEHVRFGPEQIEHARALGALHDAGWQQVIIGQDLGDQLAGDRIGQLLADSRARQAEASSPVRETAGGAADAGEDAVDAPVQDEAVAERGEAQRRRASATAFNLELGRLAVTQLARVKLDERVVRILASVDLGGSLAGVAARGARLCLPGWVTETTQRNGNVKVSYLETREAHEKALELLAGAERAGELAGRALLLIALAVLADEEAIARSRRSFHGVSFRGPWAAQAEQDLRELVAERIKGGRLPALDAVLGRSDGQL